MIIENCKSKSIYYFMISELPSIKRVRTLYKNVIFSLFKTTFNKFIFLKINIKLSITYFNYTMQEMRNTISDEKTKIFERLLFSFRD